jgi:hypothetical protein
MLCQAFYIYDGQVLTFHSLFFELCCLHMIVGIWLCMKLVEIELDDDSDNDDDSLTYYIALSSRNQTKRRVLVYLPTSKTGDRRCRSRTIDRPTILNTYRRTEFLF